MTNAVADVVASAMKEWAMEHGATHYTHSFQPLTGLTAEKHDAFLTPEFCMEQKLFSFRYNRDTDLYEIASREFQEIKQKLLFRLTNFGQPFIYVEDGNYKNRGELYLRHRHEGIDLKMDYARDTLRNIHKIWSRPVHIETAVDDKRRLVTFDGKDFSERKID